MKKITVSLIAMLLIVPIAVMFSGCSNEKIEASRALVDEYYESFMDDDPDDIADLLSDSLIELYEGNDSAEIVFGSRIGVLGTELEYKIVGTSYNSDTDGVYVIIDAEVTYERDGETYKESFQMEEFDDEMLISMVDFEREKVIDGIPEELFEAYNEADYEAAAEFFSDRYYSYVSQDILFAIFDEYQYVLGDFQELKLTDEYALNIVPEGETVRAVQKAYYDATFENGMASVYLVLCVEDDEVKIYNMLTTPSFMDEMMVNIFESIGSQNYDMALAQYDESFFDSIEGGRDTVTATYDSLIAYGEYGGYEIQDWYIYETELPSGEPFKGLLAEVNVQYGDTVFYNEIMLTSDFQSPMIYGHYIE